MSKERRAAVRSDGVVIADGVVGARPGNRSGGSTRAASSDRVVAGMLRADRAFRVDLVS